MGVKTDLIFRATLFNKERGVERYNAISVL